MTSDEKANLYNPYAQNTATKLLEKLSADSEQIIGHQVTYFATDPDKNGQDHSLNEYQLYNVVCQGDLKISIDGVLKKVLTEYCRFLIKDIVVNKQRSLI